MTHHHSKMFRGKDRWVIHTAMQGRDVELTRLEGVQHDMVLGRSGTAAAEAEGAKDPKGANAPLSQAMERGGMDGGPSPDSPPPPSSRHASTNVGTHVGKRAKRPKASYMVGTVTCD